MSQDDIPGAPDPRDPGSTDEPLQPAEWAVPPQDSQSRRRFLRNTLIGSAAAAAVVGVGGTVAATPLGPRLVSSFTPVRANASPAPCPPGTVPCGNSCCESLPGTVAICTGGGQCQYTCAAGYSDCDGNLSNGCECATPICCQGGCGVTHSDGLGQHFYDCSPLGTYTVGTATEACAAYTGNPAQCSTVDCGTAGHGAVASLGAANCAVWVYSGTSAGHVLLTSGTSCFCPVITDPMWN
jgi:hypothetical protein